MCAWAYDNVFVVCLCIYECGIHMTWHACGCQGQQQVLVLIFSLVWAQGMCHCFLDAARARLAGPWVMCTTSVSGFLMWIWDIQTQAVRLVWQAFHHSEPCPPGSCLHLEFESIWRKTQTKSVFGKIIPFAFCLPPWVPSGHKVKPDKIWAESRGQGGRKSHPSRGSTDSW